MVDEASVDDCVIGARVVGGAAVVVVVVVVDEIVVGALVVVVLGNVELIVDATVVLTYFLSLRIIVVLSRSLISFSGDCCVVIPSPAMYDADR